MAENYDEKVNLLLTRSPKGRPTLPYTYQSDVRKHDYTITNKAALDYGLGLIWRKASAFRRGEMLSYSWETLFTQAAIALREKEADIAKMARARELKQLDKAADGPLQQKAKELKKAQKFALVDEQLAELAAMIKAVRKKLSKRRLKIDELQAFTKLAKSAAARLAYTMTGNQNT